MKMSTIRSALMLHLLTIFVTSSESRKCVNFENLPANKHQDVTSFWDLSNLGPVSCMRECLALDRCQSVAYRLNSFRCQLGDTKYSDVGIGNELQDGELIIYQNKEDIKKTFTGEACCNHSCGNNKKCWNIVKNKTVCTTTELVKGTAPASPQQDGLPSKQLDASDDYTHVIPGQDIKDVQPTEKQVMPSSEGKEKASRYGNFLNEFLNALGKALWYG